MLLGNFSGALVADEVRPFVFDDFTEDTAAFRIKAAVRDEGQRHQSTYSRSIHITRNSAMAALTPILRRVIGGNVPIALIDAPAAGTGKSQLFSWTMFPGCTGAKSPRE